MARTLKVPLLLLICEFVVNYPFRLVGQRTHMSPADADVPFLFELSRNGVPWVPECLLPGQARELELLCSLAGYVGQFGCRKYNPL